MSGESRASHADAGITRSTNVTWHDGRLTREERWRLLSCRGATVWFTGLSASGKSTIAAELEALLVQRGIRCYRLDGDNLRHGLNRNLGFSAEDRAENIRRVGEVARLFADSGCIVLTSFISPYQRERDLCRALHAADAPPSQGSLPFFEVFVDTPIEVCERRDPKGLYRKARAGEVRGFTGIDDPYERPDKPDLVLKPAQSTPAECAEACAALLREHGVIPP